MIIDIIGGGSLGLLFAGKLVSNGIRVRLWCRSVEQSRLLTTEGLYVEMTSSSSANDIRGLKIDADVMDHFLDTWAKHPGDWIFLMTKQKDVEEIVSSYLRRMDELSLHKVKGIVCFQNGVGHLAVLASVNPSWSIYAAITTEAANTQAYNKVNHAGQGVTLMGQSIHNKNGQEVFLPKDENELVNILNKAGFKWDLSNEIDKFIYRKLLINAVINPLTALWGITNGELLAMDSRMDMMRKLFDEGTAVYDACGIAWDTDLWNQILHVCEMTSRNTSSMLNDITRSRPTEIHWINGSIVTLAEAHGIEAIYHKKMVEWIEEIHRVEE
ncbi:ketopantoate reductase family protein [Paenibacillus sp. CMAA1364]